MVGFYGLNTKVRINFACWGCQECLIKVGGSQYDTFRRNQQKWVFSSVLAVTRNEGGGSHESSCLPVFTAQTTLELFISYFLGNLSIVFYLFMLPKMLHVVIAMNYTRESFSHTLVTKRAPIGYCLISISWEKTSNYTSTGKKKKYICAVSSIQAIKTLYKLWKYFVSIYWSWNTKICITPSLLRPQPLQQTISLILYF